MVKEKFISAIIGTLFFAVFQPFGMSDFGMLERLLMDCGILFIALISCLTSEVATTYVLRLPHPSSNPELLKHGPRYAFKRAIWFQVINVVLLTVLLTLFFGRFANTERIDNQFNIETCLRVLIASIGCCSFIGLYWRNVYWKRYYAQQLEESQLLNGVLMERARQMEISARSGPVEPVAAEKTDCIVLEGSTKGSVSFRLSDFLFAESEGNYVSIHYIEEEKETQNMLRTSMKNVVNELCTNNHIMQCHRAFIVNLNHVIRVEGRSSGIGLILRHCDTTVPVSKGYASEVKEYIKKPKQPVLPSKK